MVNKILACEQSPTVDSWMHKAIAANSISSRSYSGLVVVQWSAPDSITVYLQVVIKWGNDNASTSAKKFC